MYVLDMPTCNKGRQLAWLTTRGPTWAIGLPGPLALAAAKGLLVCFLTMHWASASQLPERVLRVKIFGWFLTVVNNKYILIFDPRFLLL